MLLFNAYTRTHGPLHSDTVVSIFPPRKLEKNYYFAIRAPQYRCGMLCLIKFTLVSNISPGRLIETVVLLPTLAVFTFRFFFLAVTFVYIRYEYVSEHGVGIYL